MHAAAKRVVKFVGGPCDGLECRDDSADHFESSIAIVWSLFRIGCGGPLSSPDALRLRHARRLEKTESLAAPPSDAVRVASACYRVSWRTLQGQTLVSVACHATSGRRRP
jgi:hypothetical protein